MSLCQIKHEKEVQKDPLDLQVTEIYLLAQSCLILCDPMDCSPPDSSVHGISQVRILVWVAISFSGVSSQGANLCLLHLLIGRQVLYPWAIWVPHEMTNNNIILKDKKV